MTGMDDVQGLLSTMNQGATDLDDLTSQVAGLKDPLASAWEGDEADAAVDFLANLSSKMQGMSEEVRKVRSWVENTRNNYEEAAAKGAAAYQG